MIAFWIDQLAGWTCVYLSWVVLHELGDRRRGPLIGNWMMRGGLFFFGASLAYITGLKLLGWPSQYPVPILLVGLSLLLFGISMTHKR